MDDFIGIIAMMIAACILGLAGAFVCFGTLDSTVVKQCERYGYWQSGQTRVLCAVEKPGGKTRDTT